LLAYELPRQLLYSKIPTPRILNKSKKYIDEINPLFALAHDPDAKKGKRAEDTVHISNTTKRRYAP